MFVGGVPVAALAAKRPVVIPAGVPWTPAALGSAVLAWWDATQGVTLGSGSAVASWADRVNGLVASQATAANQPTFSATARNGKPGLTFNGTSHVLPFDASSLPLGTAPCVIAGAAYGGGTNNTSRSLLGYGTAASQKWKKLCTSGGNVDGSVYGGDLSTSIVWNGFDRFGIWNALSGAQEMFVDGASAGTSTGAINTSGTSGFVGSDIANEYWAGTIQQIFVLSAAMSVSNRQKLEGWESWTDGKAGSNLPSGHPYKSRAPLTSDP